MKNNFDFGGWATKINLKCGDGRTIERDAFKHQDGLTVPLVWNHQHNTPENVLGHAILENRDAGVYAYCKLNDTETGKNAKQLVKHGDIVSLSIYANHIKQTNGHVYHGSIREVSLVLAGSNPGAFIDSIKHDDISDEEDAIIFTGKNVLLYHTDTLKDKAAETKVKDETKEDQKEELKDDAKNVKDVNKEKTVADVVNELTEEQKNVLYALVGEALSNQEDDENKKDEVKEVKHNVFEGQEENESYESDVLTHAEMQGIFNDAKRYGTLRESFLAHGIEQIDWLFPDAKTMTAEPSFVKRDTDWVQGVMSSTHKTPFSRIKSLFADITKDEARARGYIKGKAKTEEIFSLLKRTTTPTTIYKKQKIDRDDLVDITDFDVVSWLKKEMRIMLDEEIARAILVGDGRLNSSDDKINETNIRPIWTDEDLYTIKEVVPTTTDSSASDNAKAFIRTAIKARKNYKGSGNPVLYASEDVISDCLLLEDKNERMIYDSIDKLATTMRVSKIVSVPVLEGLSRKVEGVDHNLMGIIVNLKDYNVGADKGGAINMFDDFDIDYNANKYLIETRCSGALITPYSAIVLETVEDAAGEG